MVSAWDAATRPAFADLRAMLPGDDHEAAWLSVLDVRRSGTTIQVTLGHDTRKLYRGDWDEPGALEKQLREASRNYAGRVQSEIE